MKNTPLSSEEVIKINEAIQRDGFFGAIEEMCKIKRLREEAPVESNSYQQVVEVPKETPEYRPAEVNSFINEPAQTGDEASIYRDSAVDLVEQDNDSSSLNRGKTKVLTNPSIPSGVPKSVGASNFADAQIVTPGSNQEKSQVL